MRLCRIFEFLIDEDLPKDTMIFFAVDPTGFEMSVLNLCEALMACSCV